MILNQQTFMYFEEKTELQKTRTGRRRARPGGRTEENSRHLGCSSPRFLWSGPRDLASGLQLLERLFPMVNPNKPETSQFQCGALCFLTAIFSLLSHSLLNYLLYFWWDNLAFNILFCFSINLLNSSFRVSFQLPG